MRVKNGLTRRSMRCLKLITFVVITISAFNYAPRLFAEDESELRTRISSTNGIIEQLETEIALHEADLAKTQKEKNTLDSTLRTIDISRKKLSTEIAVTQNKIGSLGLQIEELGIGVADKQTRITKNTSGIKSLMRKLEIEGDNTLVELILSEGTLSDAWDSVYVLERSQAEISRHIRALEIEKARLETSMTELANTKASIERQKSKLVDQKTIADENKNAKSRLLAQTKNEEENYKKLLNDKIAEKEKFLQDLRDYEAQLQIQIDPNSLPSENSGVLAWPLDSVRITQYFGNTDFAKANPILYNGNGHNGVDLGASIGTPIKSSASGVVIGTGDTDVGCPGGSYGKWVLIKHGNGLTTLYAHLSMIKVTKGQTIERGDLVAYSGNTGYSTGPHLHFTVYASQAVSVGQLTRKNGTASKCTAMPLSSYNGYLNPLTYLKER